MLTRQEELLRLMGAAAESAPSSASLVAIAETGDSSAVLERCREVLGVVLEFGEDNWPDLARWSGALPTWFVEACGPEKMPERSADWLAWHASLSPEERWDLADSEPWRLSEWIDWLRPSRRTWYWLGASAAIPSVLTVWLVTQGSPAPTGALEWLLTVSGATDVDLD